MKSLDFTAFEVTFAMFKFYFFLLFNEKKPTSWPSHICAILALFLGFDYFESIWMVLKSFLKCPEFQDGGFKKRLSN